MPLAIDEWESAAECMAVISNFPPTADVIPLGPIAIVGPPDPPETNDEDAHP